LSEVQRESDLLKRKKETKEERKKGEKREREKKGEKDIFSPCEQKVVAGVGVGCSWVNPWVGVAHRQVVTWVVSSHVLVMAG